MTKTDYVKKEEGKLTPEEFRAQRTAGNKKWLIGLLLFVCALVAFSIVYRFFYIHS